jgi:hypothetical protein
MHVSDDVKQYRLGVRGVAHDAAKEGENRGERKCDWVSGTSFFRAAMPPARRPAERATPPAYVKDFLKFRLPGKNHAL